MELLCCHPAACRTFGIYRTSAKSASHWFAANRDTLLFDTGMGFLRCGRMRGSLCARQAARGALARALRPCLRAALLQLNRFVHPDDLNRFAEKPSDHRSSRIDADSVFVRSRRFCPKTSIGHEQFLRRDTGEPSNRLRITCLWTLAVWRFSFLLSPGHTKGSIVAYIDKDKLLLLTGDTWNPAYLAVLPGMSIVGCLYTQTVRHPCAAYQREACAALP